MSSENDEPKSWRLLGETVYPDDQPPDPIRVRSDPISINVAICGALGLDPHLLQSVTLRLSKHHDPMVEVVACVREAGELVEQLSKYELVEKPEGQ